MTKRSWCVPETKVIRTQETSEIGRDYRGDVVAVQRSIDFTWHIEDSASTCCKSKTSANEAKAFSPPDKFCFQVFFLGSVGSVNF